MSTLRGRTVAFLVAAEGAEQVELTRPWQAVAEAGGTPRLVSTRAGRVQAFHRLDRADTFPVDDVLGEVSADGYDALVLPGGVANPDFLRTDRRAVAFVRAFFDTGRPVAAICHAPWTLVEADVVRGRTLTSFPSVRTDLVNAGAHWVDEQVHICTDGPNVLVTSRRPADLPAFTEALLAVFARASRPAGHRTVPHTADLRIEAWGPTREECVAQTVLGLVGGFAVLPPEPAGVTREYALDAATDDRLLVAVLEEVVYRMEADGELPVAVTMTPTDGGALVRFTMVDCAAAEQIGAVPKAVSLHGLRLAHGPYGWACAVTLDV